MNTNLFGEKNRISTFGCGSVTGGARKMNNAFVFDEEQFRNAFKVNKNVSEEQNVSFVRQVASGEFTSGESRVSTNPENVSQRSGSALFEEEKVFVSSVMSTLSDSRHFNNEFRNLVQSEDDQVD